MVRRFHSTDLVRLAPWQLGVNDKARAGLHEIKTDGMQQLSFSLQPVISILSEGLAIPFRDFIGAASNRRIGCAEAINEIDQDEHAAISVSALAFHPSYL